MDHQQPDIQKFAGELAERRGGTPRDTLEYYRLQGAIICAIESALQHGRNLETDLERPLFGKYGVLDNLARSLTLEEAAHMKPTYSSLLHLLERVAWNIASDQRTVDARNTIALIDYMKAEAPKLSSEFAALFPAGKEGAETAAEVYSAACDSVLQAIATMNTGAPGERFIKQSRIMAEKVIAALFALELSGPPGALERLVHGEDRERMVKAVHDVMIGPLAAKAAPATKAGGNGNA